MSLLIFSKTLKKPVRKYWTQICDLFYYMSNELGRHFAGKNCYVIVLYIHG